MPRQRNGRGAAGEGLRSRDLKAQTEKPGRAAVEGACPPALEVVVGFEEGFRVLAVAEPDPGRGEYAGALAQQVEGEKAQHSRRRPGSAVDQGQQDGEG